MILKTPKFWYRTQDEPAPIIEHMLAPLSWLYAVGHRIRQGAQTPVKIPTPVLCVGNLVAGGSGKTPTALALMEIIKNNDAINAPHFLTRGYGGSKQGAYLVQAGQHSVKDCGDEALMLNAHAPTVASKDRVAGAKLAITNGADLIVMDDGLQNPALRKDLSFVVISGDMGFGNDRMIPAGPLREPINKGLEKADSFILIGEDQRNALDLLPDKPVFKAFFHTDEHDLPPKDQKYIGFAGLGYPDKFFSYLKNLGYELTDTVHFADHHPYTLKDLEVLQKQAQSQGAALITTEKDMMRLAASDIQIHSLPVHLVWENEQSLVEFLQTKLTKT